MKRWHEIESTHREAVLLALESEAESAERAALANAKLGGNPDAFEGDAEAFRVAIAVLNAVAEKGERIATARPFASTAISGSSGEHIRSPSRCDD